ncbi:Predicted dehydrogenase [Nakamurella panacisegetis]|uniref:Predicted dehydrogenase n=1 Tax=Nakamurella panacisegetis TaxID=1090615 RepID=A0A1H0MMZ8_9ACTN|nr:Gfo/Idh/MocA family oxidoreductase [Nakamurella panacisegetis]SDO81530.1 Predicted dehydrogenase [Nakamurella panacisegetis]
MTLTPYTVGIVGTGWRADFFARLAQLMPDRFTLVGVAARRTESAERATARWQVPGYLDPGELQRRQRPDFVVSSVPWPANPAVLTDVVGAGGRVLSETPPAPDEAGLRALWDAVGDRRMVQVAEQYLLLPAHAARMAVVRGGVIGTPTSVQVSSTHGYHAVSMMRGFLGAGFGPATVCARTFDAPLVDPLTRAGWTDDDTEKPATTIIATVDLGDGLSGLYDFTDNQWHNQLRFRRILIRGSRGEIDDNRVIRLAEPRGITESELRRYQLGHDLNLDGHDTEHFSFDGTIVYRNPFVGHRLMDEEIAIASIMAATGAWARDAGPAPYPLADGCQDHLISLAIDESALTGEPVTTSVGPWSDAG